MAFHSRIDSPEIPKFSDLKRLACDQLIYLLEQLPGRKDLFIEADLMSPLDRIANVSILKQHEVDKLYRLDNKPVISSCDQLCFLIRPHIQAVKWISEIVNSDKITGKCRKYKIIFCPQKFYVCEAVLEEQGVFGDVTCDEWEFYFLPLDDDIISLELPEFFRDYFLDGDQRWVFATAKALHYFHSLFGLPLKVYGIGKCAKMTYEMWRQFIEEGEKKLSTDKTGNLFIFDRDVDFVTPLCSQVVYEGLLDDVFRIKCGSVELCSDVTASDKTIKVLLNSQDKVFNEIRNEHFSNVFGFLSQKAKNLQTAYDKRQGMDIKQMKNFVSQELKGLKQEHRLLSLHISASEYIMKRKTKLDFQELLKVEHSLLDGFNVRESISYIEEHIIRQISMFESLRLLCLLSLTENGLVSKDYRSLKSQYLQSYGIEHVLTFANLRQMGLLVEQQPGETFTAMESTVGKLVADKAVGKLTDAFSSLAKKSNFRALSKKLTLIPKSNEEYDLHSPPDMAYIFSGAYIPLSCKLIEQVLERDGWNGLEEVARMLNGNEFAVAAGGGGAGESKPKPQSSRLMFVIFLGGCTFSEISALRFLGKQKGYKFIIITTAITNSSRLLESLNDGHS
uniref:VPS33B late endosome and lysosome associated n=1 Tax=Erpetoichthys calabaricus TaxID=27687 RepID=A0A8C4TIK1_ERPCA